METKRVKNTPEELSELEKLNKEFRRSLYQIDDLHNKEYALADIIKEYVDKRFDLLIEDLKNKNKT